MKRKMKTPKEKASEFYRELLPHNCWNCRKWRVQICRCLETIIYLGRKHDFNEQIGSECGYWEA